VDLAFPALASAGAGFAEAQRLELGPVMGFNWIGSTGFADYTKLWPVVLAGGQQETCFMHVSKHST